MNEPILEYVKRRLEEFKGQWKRIHEDTQVPYATIANIVYGRSTNPELDTIQPLIDWFQARDEMVAKLRKSNAA